MPARCSTVPGGGCSHLPGRLCFLDETCSTSSDSRSLIGCNAGGAPNCRYCGFFQFKACPAFSPLPPPPLREPRPPAPHRPVGAISSHHAARGGPSHLGPAHLGPSHLVVHRHTVALTPIVGGFFLGILLVSSLAVLCVVRIVKRNELFRRAVSQQLTKLPTLVEFVRRGAKASTDLSTNLEDAIGELPIKERIGTMKSCVGEMGSTLCRFLIRQPARITSSTPSLQGDDLVSSWRERITNWGSSIRSCVHELPARIPTLPKCMDGVSYSPLPLKRGRNGYSMDLDRGSVLALGPNAAVFGDSSEVSFTPSQLD